MLVRVMMLFWIVVCTPVQTNAEERLTFSAVDVPAVTPKAVEALRRAYHTLGIEFEVVLTNPRRALVMSSSGRTDGEIVRVREVAEQFPTLLRVKVPLVVARTYGYAVNVNLRNLPLRDLYRLRAGYVTGARYASEIARPFAEVWTADTPEQLLEMLAHDRLDIVILGEATQRRVTAQMGMTNVFPIPSTLRQVGFYHFLHQSHADLVPRVEAALRHVLEPGAEAAVPPIAPRPVPVPPRLSPIRMM